MHGSRAFRHLRGGSKGEPQDADKSIQLRITTFFTDVLQNELGGTDNTSPAGLDVDTVQWSPSGPRINFSTSTASWLSRVVASPADKSQVVYHLHSEILNGGSHPLRRVFESLVKLLSQLMLAAGASCTERSDAAAQVVRSAARGMESACSGLSRLVLQVLPPLQMALTEAYVVEVVRTSLFDRMDGVLRKLLTAAHGAENDEANEAVIALGRGLLPSHLGVSRPLWLESEAQPYATVVDLLRSLPLVATAEQKLSLVQDACIEIDACIRRHHPEVSAEGLDSSIALCADELIPILAYALVCAELNEMLIELRFIEAFWPAAEEHKLLGSAGYSLATFQSAIEVVRASRSNVDWAQFLSPNSATRTDMDARSPQPLVSDSNDDGAGVGCSARTQSAGRAAADPPLGKQHLHGRASSSSPAMAEAEAAPIADLESWAATVLDADEAFLSSNERKEMQKGELIDAIRQDEKEQSEKERNPDVRVRSSGACLDVEL
ncbi:hypothetical protein AB1Y20_000977 [Prymnesium parvum]|uniref:VPS9 domain-containing protein n=1 Tax=Prymnesium parvum TaxID=97485 RepID=A0AB34K6Z3_PRYPA